MSGRETARAREIAGELVVEWRGQTFVASRSTPGRWYSATGDWCACPQFTFKRRCRHQDAVNERNKERYQQARGAA